MGRCRRSPGVRVEVLRVQQGPRAAWTREGSGGQRVGSRAASHGHGVHCGRTGARAAVGRQGGELAESAGLSGGCRGQGCSLTGEGGRSWGR